nr:LuxR family transcriptional regulator [Salsipaludibacter albus]
MPASIELVERDHELEVLRSLVRDAATGRGAVVAISGEAGIGKSSLVAAWCRDLGPDTRLLTGWCDDFLTKRTLGPLRDIARRTGGPLAEAVAGTNTGTILDAVLAELENPLYPTVLVVEDVHWADDATLDVLRYVGRRIAPLPAVLAMTYRDVDLDTDHPLHGVLAALPATTHRLALQPLSPWAVRELTGADDREAEEVVRLTRGNPYFVGEVVRHGTEDLPTNVADFVLARVQSLPGPAREVVELLAVIPAGADHDLVGRLGIASDDLAVAEARGILAVDEHDVRFRHELTRLAVLGALPASTRIAHHQAVLAQVLDTDDDAAVLHHAVEAGRGDVVVALGPRAAREAFRLGAHREAVAHQANVLARGDQLEAADLADLLEQHAWTLYTLHRFDEAVDAAARAVTLRRDLDQPVALAHALTTRGRMHFMANDPTASIDSAEEAVGLLEQHGTDEQRIEGLVARAETYALIEDPPELARQLAEEAVVATEGMARPDLRSLALNYRAISQCAAGGQPDIRDFHEAIRLALEGGHLELAARAWVNLSFELMLSREPTEHALPVLDEALDFLEDHDFASHAFDIRARKATVRFLLGDWDDAERELRDLRATTDQHGLIDLIALETLARLAVRRGDPDADELLCTAWGLARRSGAAPYLGLIGVIRVEQSWIDGDAEAAAARLDALPLGRLRPRLRAEALRYARMAGVEVSIPPDVAEPWAAGLRGDWQQAAQAWEEDARPYERALELLASGEAAPMQEAVRVLDDLGAEAVAAAARRRLREHGIRGIPRGPRRATREHPSGLTPRQAEVLDLLAEGLTNNEIADRLVLSVRTVDHHVAAILQKLDVASRHEAVEQAGLLDPGWR